MEASCPKYYYKIFYHRLGITKYFIICNVIQQKVHKVGKRNFTREAFKENEVKMIKIMFLQKIVGRDIQQLHTKVLG